MYRHNLFFVTNEHRFTAATMAAILNTDNRYNQTSISFEAEGDTVVFVSPERSLNPVLKETLLSLVQGAALGFAYRKDKEEDDYHTESVICVRTPTVGFDNEFELTGQQHLVLEGVGDIMKAKTIHGLLNDHWHMITGPHVTRDCVTWWFSK